MQSRPPIIEQHEGINVVRDDLHPGGTKARYLIPAFANRSEIVYASPAQGGAQTALAESARLTGKRATIFVAKRSTLHPRTAAAWAAGAKIVQVKHGYLNHVQARAKEYCEQNPDAWMLPFGANVPEAIHGIAHAAEQIDFEVHELWCAAGSGVLSRALAEAFPNADRHAVQVGRHLDPDDVAGATIHVHPLDFDTRSTAPAPFPSDAHYDRKAWQLCRSLSRPVPGNSHNVLFWNVAPDPFHKSP